MVKITPYENLVPCQHPFIKGHPYSDLIHNFLHARRLIRVAAFYFQLRKESVRYSGYIEENPKGLFTIALVYKGEPLRTIAVGNLGYAGELKAEVLSGNLAEAVGYDPIKSLAWQAPLVPA